MSAPHAAAADRNLLFGILALQMDFIRRDGLIAAMNAWVLDKSKPLGRILAEQGQLTSDLVQLLDAMVDRHIQVHQGDAQQSLAALSAASSVQQALQEVADADVQASLARLPTADVTQSKGTVSYHSRTAGGAGQRYRVLRPHARGGLGEVFVAEDTELHREVALKEIRPEHADSADSRGRFVLEAEITGGLEHPGIVPIYGLGSYDDGRPFYAMRFIQGDNLKEAIQRFHKAEGSQRDPGERNVAFRELLGRFVDVCNAVAYAHSRGILHRDLKPGNVMLGKYGETLVVDWGLAKPVGRPESLRDNGEATLRPNSANSGREWLSTRTGSAVGTPGFMSPEQAAGRLDQVAPASDIYSLGATLYAVLTGQAPFRGEPGEILRRVQRGAFTPPRQVKPEVPAALEAICRKAMALRPEERYRTALQLSEDVEHWLADEPVSAWPEPATVRLGRWARRHKPLVSGAAAALLVGLLALGVGGYWYGQEQARRALEEQRTDSEVRQALTQARATRQKLQDQLARAGGVFVLLNTPAEWHGQLQAARASVQQARSLAQQAAGLLDGPLGQDVEELEIQLGSDEKDYQLALALEKVRQDKATWVEGRFDHAGAVRAYGRLFAKAGLPVAEGDRKALAAQFRQSPIREQLVAALDDWGLSAGITRQKDLTDRLLALAREADPDPARNQVRDFKLWQDPPLLAKQAASLKLGARAGERTPRLSPQLYLLVGELLRRFGPDGELWLREGQAAYPADFWLNFELGNLLRARQHLEEAVGFYRAAMAVRPRSSSAHSNLGTALADKGDLAGAIHEYRQAIALDPRDARVHYNLGVTLHDKGDLAGAIHEYRRAIALDPQYAKAHSNLGNALMTRNDLVGAIRAHRQAIALEPNVALMHTNLGNALYVQKDVAAAIEEYRRAIALDPKYVKAHCGLGQALLTLGEFDAAQRAAEHSLQLLRPDNPLHGRAQTLLLKCRLAVKLKQRVDALLQRPAAPAYPTEPLSLAEFCQRYRHYPAAVRLYVVALAAQPSVAEDLAKGHCYHAACAAALAAAGQGQNAAPLTAHDQAQLRRQALDWLRAELKRLTQTVAAYQAATKEKTPSLASPLQQLAGQADKPGPADLLRVCDRLQRCLTDPDLASLRADKELVKLSKPEQQDWRAFWTDVRALAKQARSCFREKQISGRLTEEKKEQVHELKLQAGQAYVFDLESTDFNAFLRLEDATGKKLAEGDDIEPGVILNSRIVLTPTTSGNYRLVATAFAAHGTGAYVLRIREFATTK
jgi:serine/threonine protein kinase/Flp pilus assembly protein TadD